MPVCNEFPAGAFCWIDLNAHDLEGALSWYSALFDWTPTMVPSPPGAPPYAFLMKDGAVVAGAGQMSDEMKGQGIPPLWNSYVATKDCAATEAKVRELGGTVTVPTMEVPGFGKLAFFLDPEGASFAAWEDLGQGPGTRVREHGSLSWNELMMRDPAGAQAFYGALFGWSFLNTPMDSVDYHMIKNGADDAGGMMVMEGERFEGVPPHWLVYFDVEDCRATTAQAAETGGTVMVPPTDVPVGTFSVVRDPQGGVFCLISLNDAAG